MPVHLGQHHIGGAFGEKSAPLHGRQLRRVTEHQHRLAERQKIAAKIGIDHRTFIDDHEARFRHGTVFVENEGRLLCLGFARAVDQTVDRACIAATLGPHDERRLARESREGNPAIDIGGNVLGERRLARSRIAKQPEQLRLAAFQPRGHGFQRRLLLRRPDHAHSVLEFIGFWFINATRWQNPNCAPLAGCCWPR